MFFIYFSFEETDLIPGMAAFVACLVFPLEIGILAGIAINIMFILYHAARPKISIEFLSVRNIWIYSKSLFRIFEDYYHFNGIRHL